MRFPIALARLASTAGLLALLLPACRTSRPLTQRPLPTTAAIASEGLLTCFAPGTAIDGKAVWCEASAVWSDGKQVLVANDKDMPAGQSSVFSVPLTALADTSQRPTYLPASPFRSGTKYEDFAQTPDGRFTLLCTAFDRVKPGSTDWDAYNTILYWPTGQPEQARVLAPTAGSPTSVAYRELLARVLATDEYPGTLPYFKIEGLAATRTHLLFGVREAGKAYDNFKHVDKVVAVSYTVEGNQLRVGDDWRVVADFKPETADASLPAPLGLSSLEYDPARDCVWLLTSYEKGGQVDAYLWVNRLTDLLADKPFQLIRDAQGQALRFGHKAEDLTMLPDNRLLVIHDDDRVQTRVGTATRQPNQAAYTILTLK
ncbi:hypothetical protein GCM10027578_00630 [Spirosoma luteolum]